MKRRSSSPRPRAASPSSPDEPRYSRDIISSKLIGLEVDLASQVTVRHSLPRDSMAAVVDPAAVEADLTASLQLAALVIGAEVAAVAIGVEIGPTTLIASGTIASLG